MSFPLFVSIVGSCFTLAIIESSLFQKYSKLCVILFCNIVMLWLFLLL